MQDGTMIRREDRSGVAVLHLEHGKANAFDVELCSALADTLAGLRRAGAAAVVLTGRGSIFSGGVDLKRLLAEGAGYVARFLPELNRVLREVFTFPRPVVAAVNGHAVAGGALLAAAADHVIVAGGALQIGVPELSVGVPFPTLALEIVRFACGDRGAQELAYSGRLVGPEEACRLGLAHELVPADRLLDTACAAAERLAAIPPSSFWLAKNQLRHPVLERVDRLERAFEEDVLRQWQSEEALAAVRRWVDQRLTHR